MFCKWGPSHPKNRQGLRRRRGDAPAYQDGWVSGEDLGSARAEGSARASWASSAGTAKSMRSNRGRDTKPEIAVRRLLHARGFRFRVDFAPVQGLRRRADIVFTRQKLAVFIDGCFWHGCPDHYSAPGANARFWREKRDANVRRDRQTDALMIDAGWTVLRAWEHEDASAVVSRVASAYLQLTTRPAP
ncbi:very short patch repair endonuclease [Lysobacter korlensis]|uniref:Very short patch repair endonuclease n=1 Tax=Lysobacter korlensis TaxID=553636 RepID=A0ABV6RXR3_9GAMM